MIIGLNKNNADFRIIDNCELAVFEIMRNLVLADNGSLGKDIPLQMLKTVSRVEIGNEK